jgi:hypothetical protein
VKDAIYSLLSGDATLMATLTGGLHRDVEISRQTTPAAFDADREIKPCGLLKFGSQSPVAPFYHSARLFFAVMFYERNGYANTAAARARVYALLHRQRVAPSSGSCWQIRHSDDVLETQDEALGCSLEMSRFYAVINRE